MSWHHSIYVAAASVCFALSVGYIGGASTLPLTVASVLLVSTCAIKLMPVLAGRATLWGPALTVLVGYLAWLVVLVYTSTLAENSIHYAWLFAGFVFVCLATFDLSRERWIETFLLFCVTGVVLAGWGLAEFIVTERRANGPIVDPSLWGTICNLLFFATVAIFLTTDRYRYLLWSLLLLYAAASFSAYSRVGTATFALAFLFVVAVGLTQRDLRQRIGILVAIVAIAFSLVYSYSSLEEASRHDEGYTLDVQEYGWNQRFDMWRAGLAIYAENPVLGTGPGTYKVHYPRHRSPKELTNFGNFVHNDYIQFLAEGGPLMLAFLLVLVGTLVHGLFRDAVRVIKGDRDARETLLLAVALGVPLVQALMNFPLYIMQIQLLMGLLFARYLAACGMLTQRRLVLAAPRLSQFALGGVTLIAVLILAFDAVTNDLALDRDGIPLVRDIGDGSSAYLDTMSFLSTVRSRNALNRFAMATIYRTSFDAATDAASRRSLAVAAALEYQAGLELNPYHLKAREYFAQFLLQNPWLIEMEEIDSTPEQLYREGVRIFPVYIEAHMSLASFLMVIGKEEEGYRVLVEDALPWANLKHGQYFDARLELLEWVSKEAISRDDDAVLGAILDTMGIKR